MLKGWLERVLLPAAAIVMPKGEGDTIKPGLTHITRLGVFTTCGASWRLTLMRGVGPLLAPRARKVCAAQFLMDSAGKPALGAHLRKVAAAVDRLARPVRARDADVPPGP